MSTACPIDRMSDDQLTLFKRGKRWTKEEDQLLIQAVQQYDERNWREIAKKVPGRTAIQCLHRWKKILRPGQIKGPWTHSEDQIIVQWVQKYGPNWWAECSKSLNGRNGKQCRERWHNFLDPSIVQEDWLKEEDDLLVQQYRKYGPKWDQIAYELKGRTQKEVKERIYKKLQNYMDFKEKDKPQKKLVKTEVQDEDEAELLIGFSQSKKAQAEKVRSVRLDKSHGRTLLLQNKLQEFLEDYYKIKRKNKKVLRDLENMIGSLKQDILSLQQSGTPFAYPHFPPPPMFPFAKFQPPAFPQHMIPHFYPQGQYEDIVEVNRSFHQRQL